MQKHGIEEHDVGAALACAGELTGREECRFLPR